MVIRENNAGLEGCSRRGNVPLRYMWRTVDKGLDGCGYGVRMSEHAGCGYPREEDEMRQTTTPHNPSIKSDLGALAGLYRTVFWMIGRKSQYGRIWPREADMGSLESEPMIEAPLFEMPERSAVEVGARE
jgi:hypothetical protein